MRWFALLACTAAVAVAAPGRTEAPAEAGIRSKYALPLTSMEVAGLTLLTSTFDDAEAVFGPARLQTRPSGLESIVSICYTSAQTGDHTVLELKSTGIGKGKFLTHYTLLTTPKRAACAPSPKIGAGLAVLDGRLHLGMSKDQVTAAIGEPATHNLDSWPLGNLPDNKPPNTWTYMTTWHAPFSQVDQAAIDALLGQGDSEVHRYAWTQLMLRFRDSKLVRIDVDHGVGY